MTLPQVTKDEKRVGLTPADISEIRRRADDDVFYFGKVICGHKDLVFVDHAPLMYATAGDAAKLIALLRSNLTSFTIRAFRKECVRLGLDIWAEDAVGRLAEKLRVVDLRVYRGSGKSSALTHATRLWRMVKDPDLSVALITNVEKPKARDFCKQIRATIQSEFFAVIYPDRVPADQKSMLTESSLTVAGRTVPDKEPCLMAFGYATSPTGYHFDEIQFDDLVGRENHSIAELAVVRDFLTNVQELYNPGIRRPIRRIHVGTRWDEEDDAYEVRRYAHTFQITIPIWYRDQPVDDIRQHGVPTTEWKPLDRIIAKQEETLSNPDEGALSWRCNNELDPTVAGGRIFPAEMVDAANWIPYRNAEVTKGIEWVTRPQWDPKTGERKDKNLAFDPKTFHLVAAFDQSFSADGDEWAGCVEGMDQYGHRYVLDRRTGHGIEEMLDAAEMIRLLWNPRRIGMEKIAAQHVIELVLKLGEKYRRLRPLVEPIPHNNVAKEYRIRNYVAEVMKMKRLWLHPRDVETKQEMKKYKPGPNAKDNILDALAMCEVMIQNSHAPREGQEDYKKKFASINAARKSRTSMGIPLY